MRIGEPATQFPGAMPLGATRDAEAARQAAEAAGTELRAMGLNQNFAPNADVNVDPANPVIGVRSFGSDPDLVAEFVAAQIERLPAPGAWRCPPSTSRATATPGPTATWACRSSPTPRRSGSGSTPRRSRRRSRPATDMVMSAHLQFPALDDSLKPATLSEPILTGLLRERLGFEGVIVTDALEMQGVRTEYGDERVPVMALQAGADLLLMPPDFPLAYEAVLAAVEAGELTEERIDASVRRLLELKYARGIADDPMTDPGAASELVGADAHLEVAAGIADRSITLLANDGTLPFAGGGVLVTGWGENTTANLAASLESQGLQAEALVTGEEPERGGRSRPRSPPPKAATWRWSRPATCKPVPRRRTWSPRC